MAIAGTALGLAGCRPVGSGDAAGNQAKGGPVRHYPVTGTVVGTNAETGQVELDAQAIPGFMDAMTMPYTLKDPGELKQLHHGDVLTATLDVDGNGARLDAVKVTSRTAETLEPEPQSLMKPLKPGEAVPEFALTDQDGKTIHLGDYHGKLLLLTFIYTHCPLSDYCPRMSHNFADINVALARSPAAYAATHLLSVSFDPKRDTPPVLRSYGGKYTQETFDHWTFAAPREDDLTPLLKFFDVGAAPAPGGTLTHTLSTVLIGKDGKILNWYTGNDWTVPQVLSDMQKALENKGGKA
jgi:protein SCO1/2